MRVLLVALLCTCVVLALADGGNDNGGSNSGSSNGGNGNGNGNGNSGRGRDRSVDWSRQGNHAIRIRSRLVTNENGNICDFRFTTNGFPRFRQFWFNRNSDSDSAASFAFRVGLRGLFEYVDNGSGNATSFVRGVTFVGKTQNWNNIASSSRVDSATNATIYSFNTTYTDTTYTNLRVTISMDVVNSFATVTNNVTVNPNAAKWSILIANWPWAQNNTKLALRLFVQSSQGRAQSGNATIVVGSNYGAFGWQPVAFGGNSASAVNNSIPLTASSVFADSDPAGSPTSDDDDSVSGETASSVFFTFNTNTQYTNLLWDPTVSIGDTSLDTSPAPAVARPAAATAFLAVLIALLTIFF